MCTEKYDQWLSEERMHNEIAEGNLKDLESWAALPSEIIKQSFKKLELKIKFIILNSDDYILMALGHL